MTKDSASAAAGIRFGDQVLSLNGTEVLGMTGQKVSFVYSYFSFFLPHAPLDISSQLLYVAKHILHPQVMDMMKKTKELVLMLKDRSVKFWKNFIMELEPPKWLHIAGFEYWKRIVSLLCKFSTG